MDVALFGFCLTASIGMSSSTSVWNVFGQMEIGILGKFEMTGVVSPNGLILEGSFLSRQGSLVEAVEDGLIGTLARWTPFWLQPDDDALDGEEPRDTIVGAWLHKKLIGSAQSLEDSCEEGELCGNAWFKLWDVKVRGRHACPYPCHHVPCVSRASRVHLPRLSTHPLLILPSDPVVAHAQIVLSSVTFDLRVSWKMKFGGLTFDDAGFQLPLPDEWFKDVLGLDDQEFQEEVRHWATEVGTLAMPNALC